MTTMPIDNHPVTQRRLQFIGIDVNKLTLLEFIFISVTILLKLNIEDVIGLLYV